MARRCRRSTSSRSCRSNSSSTRTRAAAGSTIRAPTGASFWTGQDTQLTPGSVSHPRRIVDNTSEEGVFGSSECLKRVARRVLEGAVGRCRSSARCKTSTAFQLHPIGTRASQACDAPRRGAGPEPDRHRRAVAARVHAHQLQLPRPARLLLLAPCAVLEQNPKLFLLHHFLSGEHYLLVGICSAVLSNASH